MKKSIAFLAGIVLSVGLFGQSSPTKPYPQVGRPCPDFTLTSISYYAKTKASLKDFRGKWLVLDFWNEHCGACIAAFPKVSAIQQEFADKLRWMMVGPENIKNYKRYPRQFYAKYREKENLVMPCAFDSVLTPQWDIGAVPRLVVIDDKGIVRAITHFLNRAQVKVYLSGGAPDVAQHADAGGTIFSDFHIPRNLDKPFLLNGNGGDDSNFFYRSLISRFNELKQIGSKPDMDASVKSGLFEAVGWPLAALFNYAWLGNDIPAGAGWARGDTTYGKFCNEPVLEIKDTSLFQYSSEHPENLFAYSLVLPKAHLSQLKILECMQHDLCQNFGYTGAIETRNFPCWRLRIAPEAKEKLLSKIDKQPVLVTYTKNGFRGKNYPFIALIMQMYGVADRRHELVIDETGIDMQTKIDVIVEDNVWVDMDDVIKAMKDNGLEMIRSEQKMKVLVVRDAK